MSKMSAEELEGRLNAQRDVLARLLAWATSQERSEGLLTALTASWQVKDHQEDPGAVPAAGLAIEGAMEREMRLIIESAEAYRAGCAGE
jgi:hypothetical protein